MNLRRNNKIISSEFQVWKHNARGVTEELSQLNAPTPCYYLHQDHIGSAAISFCQGHGLVSDVSKKGKKNFIPLFILSISISFSVRFVYIEYKKQISLFESIARTCLPEERYVGDHAVTKGYRVFTLTRE